MTPRNGSLCRFGVFELNLNSAELRKSGAKVRLQEQQYQLLLKLIEHDGEVVSRHELRSTLWHEDTYVDFETGLNTAVKRVRETLGDSAESPTFIETIPRRGYRFIARVEWLGANPGAITTPKRLPEPTPRPRFVRWTMAAAAGIAVILALAFILQPKPRIPSVVSVTRITNDAKPKTSINPFAFDGGNLYFVEGQPFTSRSGIAQVSAKGGETSWIQTSLHQPVAIYSVSPVRPEMMVLDLAGSMAGDAAVWVQPLPAGSPYSLANIHASSICWSPDGSHVVYADQRNVVSIAKPDGTEPRELAKLPGQAWTLRFSPDGRRIRFSLLHPPNLSNSSIWEMDADGRNIHPLFPEWEKGGPAQCCGNWSPDGNHYYFQAGEGATEALWALTEHRSLLGKTSRFPTRLTSGAPLHFGSATPDPDGKTLYVVGEDLRVELFRYDSASRHADPYLPGFSAGPVSYSADGKWMAYTAYPEMTLWRSRPDGSEKMQLTFPPMRAYGARWSPDGSRIVFMDMQLSRPWKMYVIPSSGGTPERLTNESIIDSETDPMWTPDGRSIVFGTQGLDKNQTTIQVLDLQTRNATLVPGSAGQESPRVSPDGRYISTINAPQTELMLFDRKTDRWSSLAAGDVLSFNEWSHDGKYVYMQQSENASGAIVRVRVKDRKLETVLSLKDFPMNTDGDWMGLTPDDSVLLMRDHSVQEIYALGLQFR